MKILIMAHPCIHTGGAERWWYYVLNELRKANIFMFIAIPLSLRRGCYECPKMLLSSNVRIIYVTSGMLSWIKTLIKVIRGEGVDLIISGYQTPQVVLATLIAAMITKRKHFTMFHTPIGWLPYTQSAELSNVAKLWIKFYKFINDYLSCFILSSPSVIYDLRRVHLNVTKYCSVKGSAVIRPIEVAYRSYEERDIDLIYLASISKAKGIYDILLLISRVKERRPDIKAIIIGKIHEGLKEEVEKMLTSYGIKDNVELLGYVDGVKKFELLSRSKIMAYPSYMDTFAISVLEALAMGTPVVAYAIPAIVVNYRTEAVIKVPVGSIDRMVKEVYEVLNDKQHWQKLSKEAFSYASTYNWNNIAKSLLTCIMNCLGR